jgi:hypothetical protein
MPHESTELIADPTGFEEFLDRITLKDDIEFDLMLAEMDQFSLTFMRPSAPVERRCQFVSVPLRLPDGSELRCIRLRRSRSLRVAEPRGLIAGSLVAGDGLALLRGQLDHTDLPARSSSTALSTISFAASLTPAAASTPMFAKMSISLLESAPDVAASRCAWTQR